MMPEQSRLATLGALLSMALIAIGAWRVYAVVAASPMLGYANQFDMRRISACAGLWPDVAVAERLQAHPQAPVRRYVAGEFRPDECYVSSELVFVAPAAFIAHAVGVVDLRVVGLIKACALVALALALNVLLRSRPAWRLLHAVVFALVICDPLNTLWLNGLYTEFAALLGAYGAIVLLIAIAGRPAVAAPVPTGIIAAFAISLVFLGLSRQQHFLLPAILALPAVLALWRPARRAALALTLIVLAIALAQLVVIGRHPTIAAANSADTVLGALLPASQDQAQTAARLGLPERCLQSVGATWYEPMGETLQTACPEVLALPRAVVLRLVFAEPITIARTLTRALPQLQDWRLGYLGTVEDATFAGAEAVRDIGGVASTSIAPFVTAMRPRIFLLALTASLALLAAGAVVAVIGVLRRRAEPLAVTLYALCATAWYAIATAVLGDGYVEVARHAQLAAVSLCALTVVLGGASVGPLALLVVRRTDSDARRGAFVAMGFIAFALVVPLLVQQTLQRAMMRLPMTIGVVDRPRTNDVATATVEFAGWALDPQGVSAVEVLTGEGAAYRAAIGLPYAGGRGESLGLYYPSYPQTATAGFLAQLPASAISDQGLDVRTIVVNTSGARTEIDRRRLFPKSP